MTTPYLKENDKYISAYIKMICSLVAQKEGKKIQAKIGEIREIIKIICDIEADVRVMAHIAPSMDTEPKPEQYPLYWFNAYAWSMVNKKMGVKKRADSRKPSKTNKKSARGLHS